MVDGLASVITTEPSPKCFYLAGIGSGFWILLAIQVTLLAMLVPVWGF